MEATRTLREVNQDLKRVELKIQEVDDALGMLAADEKEYRKNNNGTASVDWQLLQSKLERLQRKEESFRRQQELLMQQHTAPSSGKTPTDTHTHTHHSLYTPPLS